MSTKILALDIGTDVVRAFEMQVNFRNSLPLATYEEQVFVQEEESLLEAQVQAVARMIETHQLRHDTFTCNLPRHLVSTLTISLPFIQKKQIEMTIGTQIDDLLPIDEEDVFYDYQIISQSEKNQTPPETKLLVAYVKKDEYERFLSLLEQNHIDPRLITIGILGYQSLINPKIENAQIILNIGASGAEWAIFDQAKLQQFYSIETGGKAIDIELAEAFRVPTKQAEEGKILEAEISDEPAFDFENDQQELRSSLIRDAILSAIKPLEQAIFRSIAAYEKNTNRSVDVIYLTGGGSQLKGLKAYLAKRFMVDVENLEVPTGFSETMEEQFPLISQAYAMALLVAKNQTGKLLHFRKGPYAYTGDFGFLKGRLIGVALALISMAGSLYMEYQVKQEMIEQEIAMLNEQVNQMSQNLLGEPDASAERILSVVTAEQKDSKKIPEYSAFYTIGELSQNIGTEVIVDFDRIDINISRGKLEVQGRTKSMSEVNQIVEAIKKTQCFKNQVKKEQASKGVDDRTNFRLTASSSCE
jgi:Tfp pilus assembly PilM family ATPase